MALWDTGTRQPGSHTVAIKHARKPHKYLSSFCCRVCTGYSSGVRVSAARRRQTSALAALAARPRGRAVGAWARLSRQRDAMRGGADTPRPLWQARAAAGRPVSRVP